MGALWDFCEVKVGLRRPFDNADVMFYNIDKDFIVKLSLVEPLSKPVFSHNTPGPIPRGYGSYGSRLYFMTQLLYP
jgi:hypothetical protein